MNFKVTFANGASLKLLGLPPDVTLDALRAEIFMKAGIPCDEQHIMAGYPPALIKGDGNSTLTSLGIRSGSVLVLKEAMVEGGGSDVNALRRAPRTVFIRRVVPGDNSCLFNAVGYALGKGKSGNGPMMRQAITEAILSNPSQFSEVVLGRPVHEYCAWILDDNSWGGEIEVSILATHFKLEIVVFDVTSMSRLCYGEDQGFSQRMFLLYDGIHYDIVVEAASETAPESRDICLFPINDFSKVERASEVAVEAHQTHAYTDVSGFHVLCLRCRRTFRGQREAQAHAQETGHQEFGEVKSSQG